MMELLKECELVVLSADRLIVDFDCGNDDLNDFFNHDAIHYKNQMLAQTCFFRHLETGKIVCAFSLSPNGLKTADLPGSRRKKVTSLIPREKTLKSYPAFLIGRLGVALDFGGQGIGSQLINYIKTSCLDFYPDFCRFLLVDAYNEPDVLVFYKKNDFTPIFSTEEQELESSKQNTEPLRTRYMFYDMIQWSNSLG